MDRDLLFETYLIIVNLLLWNGLWKSFILYLKSLACQRGYYGTNCSLPCSPNCKTCRPADGLCSCKAGWMGHNCSDGNSVIYYSNVCDCILDKEKTTS